MPRKTSVDVGHGGLFRTLPCTVALVTFVEKTVTYTGAIVVDGNRIVFWDKVKDPDDQAHVDLCSRAWQAATRSGHPTIGVAASGRLYKEFKACVEPPAPARKQKASERARTSEPPAPQPVFHIFAKSYPPDLRARIDRLLGKTRVKSGDSKMSRHRLHRRLSAELVGKQLKKLEPLDPALRAAWDATKHGKRRLMAGYAMSSAFALALHMMRE